MQQGIDNAMTGPTMSTVVKRRVSAAAQQLGTVDPLPYIGRLVERTFPLPAGCEQYADNCLTPGAAPLEPSYSEREPGCLRFTLSPLEPAASPSARHKEATREMRRLTGTTFGNEALRWFDRRSEEWRRDGACPGLQFGAWFGSSYDSRGLSAVKVYYETQPGQLDALPAGLKGVVEAASEFLPGLCPIFTSFRCGREKAHQRVTFERDTDLSTRDLSGLLNLLGLGHQLASVTQLTSVCFGGGSGLPKDAVLIGFGETAEGPEFKLEILLGLIPELPGRFLDLPRQLDGLSRWLRAFTPEDCSRPGEFSVLSIRVTPRSPARLSLYLRPIELEISATAGG